MTKSQTTVGIPKINTMYQDCTILYDCGSIVAFRCSVGSGCTFYPAIEFQVNHRLNGKGYEDHGCLRPTLRSLDSKTKNSCLNDNEQKEEGHSHWDEGQ